MSREVTLLIADDHPVFRSGLRALADALEYVEVVGEAATGEEAVERALATLPDVVIMDINLPGIDGVEATRRIVATSPHIRVLVLTMFDDQDSVFAAMRAGARGYLLKDADHAEIARAIEAVADGEAIFGPPVATRVLAYFARSNKAATAPAFPELTQRESEVLELVAQGLANPVIASRLVLSEKTIRNHVSNIFTKLQVADRAQAIVRAREAGLGTTRTSL